ncbi:TPA: recombinase family protein [Escherichia coli]
MKPTTPRVLAYLRASTDEQDATRAKADLLAFAEKYGVSLTTDDIYVENKSGASLERPELSALIKAATPGTILLAEQIDRITRLPAPLWASLKARLAEKHIKIVALDVPTTHRFMTIAPDASEEDIEARILEAVNDMLIDVYAALARKDYNDRRRRQRQGIDKARQEGRTTGRQRNMKLYEQVKELLDQGLGQRVIARTTGTPLATVNRIAAYWRDDAGGQAE